MSLNIDYGQRRIFEMLVTPEVAESILKERNGANRNLVDRVVQKYSSDMLSGNWFDNDQNKWIAFYLDGNLADGQHRLKAISVSGISRVMKVETGLDKIQSFGIDAHRMRTTNDQIKISDNGTWIQKNEIAITKSCIHAFVGANKAVSPSEVIQFCEKHKEAMLFVKGQKGDTVRFVTTAPLWSAVFCAYGIENKERLSEFCTVIKSGITLSPDDNAAIRLREKLLQEAGRLQTGASGRNKVIKMTMRAIKAFCERQQLKKICTPDDFIYPIKEA